MKKKNSKMKWFFLIGFVVIVVALIAYGMRDKKPGIEVTVADVKRGDITATVTATGKVQPEVIVSISSEVAGEIIELPFNDGDPVAKGDLLVSVNPDTLEAQVKQQEASLAASKAGADQARAEMHQAELDLKRLQDLSTKGYVTKEELEQSATIVEIRKAAYQSSLHQIDRQEMQLKEANDLLGKASTYSPIDGRVVSLASELGDRVVGTGQFEGTEIMRVANLDVMEVRVEVSEADIINVELDDKASVEIDAFPDQKFEGVVTEIANSAVTTGSRSQEELTTFQVKVRLLNPAARLRPGMTATAEIQTETVTDVVKIPLGAVVVRPLREVNKALGKDDGKKDEEKSAKEDENEGKGPPHGNDKKKDDRVRVVFLMKDGVAKLRKVETGIADADSIEIKEGLNADEKIITGSYRALTRELENGSEVKIAEKKKFE